MLKHTFQFNEVDIYKITQVNENVNQFTLYFIEEGPGRGSEITKKDCNVKCFDIFFFCLFDGGHAWRNHNQVKRTALK